MQYVDLGVLPRHQQGSKKKKVFKWSALAVLTFLVIYAGYLLYFPMLALLKEIFKNPSSALSLVKNPATVSLPRDIWVQVPSWTNHAAFSTKINSVYSYGETEGYPGGGQELVRTVVGQITGVPIHYVARIDRRF
jgi:anionic cell wall polymer biosynthesis LytR-Cps2A-Psr (LCP) family protein